VKAIVIVGICIGVYWWIPSNWQNQVNQWLLAAIAFIASLNRIELFIGIVGLIVLVCFFLIFINPYRRASYLATTLTAIPPISVYIDAENQLSPGAILPFTRFLMEHLNGRRADLLYFLDASKTATSAKYKALYRFGFRPIDVPHDPTGEARVKEAVDKELSMHAYERALRGPEKQEFIIVTGDQDFVALVYRLVALGHRVQIWATPIREAYRTLATYLDVNVLDLSSVVSELQADPAGSVAVALPVAKATSAPTPRRASRKKPVAKPPKQQYMPVPGVFSYTGEEQLYQAIVETVNAQIRSQKRSRSDRDRNIYFRSTLGGELGPRLASVGYGAGNRLDYWIEHLGVLGILEAEPGRSFPALGSGSMEAAASALFTMALAAAHRATEATPVREDGLIHMHEVAVALANTPSDSPKLVLLLPLVMDGGPRRSLHARYFVRCARAVGLIEFEDVPSSLDLIRSPRLLQPLALVESDDAIEGTFPQKPVTNETPILADNVLADNVLADNVLTSMSAALESSAIVEGSVGTT
jgi:hypothetical protein